MKSSRLTDANHAAGVTDQNEEPSGEEVWYRDALIWKKKFHERK